MYKIKKYEDILPALTPTTQKRFEMVRKLSNNFTQSNKTALEMDKLLAKQIEEMKKEKSPTTRSSTSLEKQAREVAKELIEDDVIGGRTVQQIKSSYAGFVNDKANVSISKSKIHVTRLGSEKVNFSFPVQSIYNEILEEAGKLYERKRTATTPKSKQKIISRKSNQKPSKAKISYENAKPVERIDEEVRFIKRYLLMNGKQMTIQKILSLLNGLQRAILERRIRKNSPYASEIKYMQEKLIGLYNFMRKSRKEIMEVQLDKKILKRFTEIAGSEQVRVSTNYLKRYVGIQGKEIDKEKAEKLMTALEKAANKKKVTKGDPYANQLNTIYASLYEFVNKAKKGDRLSIHDNALNGIESLLGCIGDPDCGCDEDNSLRGIEPTTEQPKPTIMNSMDFAEIEFETLGFMGKWLDLIGDPAEGFTAMVFGKPKMGKSFLCIDFAGYLARNHGEVLYVASEEKLDKTLQDKLNDKKVKHPSLFVSDHIPEDLSPYQFIFLDSVNTLHLTPDDLKLLKEQNPGKSFIHVFQTTKEGKFRGANTFQHDVDVVIEIPERGTAVQFGRFNQGGEMEIFNDDRSEVLEGLDGKSKSRQPIDWTEPKDLEHWEWQKLKTIKKYVDKKEYGEAMDYAMYNCDTVIREAIPPDIWLKMGGKLTSSGYEKLVNSGKKVPGLIKDKFGMWSVRRNDEK